MQIFCAKRLILEFLDYLKYKIDNDRLTMEDLESLFKTMMEGLNLSGTAQDFATFYGKSVDSVRHVLSRKVFDTPKRQVMYSFAKFSKQIPDSWRK